MSQYTDFVSMTKPEATAYLERFLDEMEPSLNRLASSADMRLSFEPASLELLWVSIAPQLAWRKGYAPPSLGQPGPRISPDQIEPADELPSWFHHPSGAGYARFSAKSLWLIDGAARYLGETLVRSGEGRWSSGNERIKNYMFQNQPVVVGIALDPVSPIQTCAVVAAKALGPSASTGPRSLSDVYDRWIASSP